MGEGHLMPDHVHMMISIPPKYAVSQVIGFIKGKSAIHLARVYGRGAASRRTCASIGWIRGIDQPPSGGSNATRLHQIIALKYFHP